MNKNYLEVKNRSILPSPPLKKRRELPAFNLKVEIGKVTIKKIGFGLLVKTPPFF